MWSVVDVAIDLQHCGGARELDFQEAWVMQWLPATQVFRL